MCWESRRQTRFRRLSQVVLTGSLKPHLRPFRRGHVVGLARTGRGNAIQLAAPTSLCRVRSQRRHGVASNIITLYVTLKDDEMIHGASGSGSVNQHLCSAVFVCMRDLDLAYEDNCGISPTERSRLSRRLDAENGYNSHAKDLRDAC